MADMFRKIVEEARDFAILLLDLEGRIEMWNVGAERTFGYSAGEVLGRHFELLFVESDRELGIPSAEIERAGTAGHADDTRWHVHKSGRGIFADGVTMSLHDEAGRVTGFVKFARDITERAETERRLATQLALTNLLSHEEPFEVASHRIMETICVNLGWDLGAMWRVAGGEIRCVDQWHASSVDDARARDLCGGSMPPHMGLIGEVWTSGEAMWLPQFRDAERFPRAPIAERAGLTTVFAFPITAQGRVLGVMEFFSQRQREPDQALMPIMTLIGAQIGDFIERERTQEALRASEERYRLASETTQRALEIEKQARAEAEATKRQLQRRADEEASFRHLASALTGAVEMTEVLYEITNRATQVTRADGVYVERIMHTAQGRMVEVVSSAGRGSPPRGLRVAFPGSMSEEVLEGSAPVILTSMQLFGKSMAPYLADTCPECEVLVTPLIAENEVLGALVLLNSKASGRRFREGDLVRARTLGDLTSLALRRVRLMEKEREAKEKAEAAVRVRDETLGIVSHDLRNPLTTIALSADLLAEAPPAEQRELIETIRTSAQRMQRLIRDLLDVARLEAGGIAVSTDVIDAESVVREVVAAHEPLAEQKKQRLVFEIGRPLPRVCADRDRLVQVLANLVSNALKFTPDRGTVTVAVRRDDGHVQFVVHDTGPGIPEADLRNVFTAYWQAKKTAHMGAGLGLAIVRGIVNAHRGQVWAENAPGGGAVFTFTVPVE